MHKLSLNYETKERRMRRGRIEKVRWCTYAKGEPASSLRSQPGGKDGRRTAQVVWWVFICFGGGWNEQRKVGEKHGGVCGTDMDNVEKPRRTLQSGNLRCSKSTCVVKKLLCLFRMRVLKI